MAEPKKMKPLSMNITDDQKRKLKQVFPEVFNEDKIDWERLRSTLGEDIDSGNERFGMTWPGKSECFRVIQEPSVGTLKPCKKESVNWDTTENLFIEGDNLEVLKLLQKSYYGKVKMIYIDPPYNTGKEFIYPDKYSESLDTYLSYTGQLDDEGKKFSSNAETDGRFHSKWMNMMYPRLFLARNLLRDDGVIFISVDDNEVSNLRKLCDEVFGEENFIANFIWEKRTNRENRKVVSSRHDYILCYCKICNTHGCPLNQLPMSEKALANYKNIDNDTKGQWKSDPATAQAGHGTKKQFYDLTAPNGKVHKLESGRCWLYTQHVMKNAIIDNQIWFGKDGNGVPRIKTYLHAKERGLTPESIIFSKDATTNEISKNRLKDIFDGIAVFETPKPVELLKLLLQLSIKEGIILDFFAGSSTAAHAALDLNKEDGGNRKFIMVQLPEKCDGKSEAYKAGYKTIADIGKERIRRVIKKIKGEQAEKQKAEETKLPMFQEQEKQNLDLGFKVFKLDKSNFNIWDVTVPKDKDISSSQIELYVDHIAPDSSDEDILHEILLKAGYELAKKIEVLNLADKKVFSIDENAFMICLERKLTKEVITEIANLQPARVVCLDKGFSDNDQLKTNAVQIMKSHGVDDFRTI